MDVAKLPAREDTALSVLHENAERLERTGTKTQQAAAAALKIVTSDIDALWIGNQSAGSARSH